MRPRARRPPSTILTHALRSAAAAALVALVALAVPAFARHSVHVHAVRNATLHKRIVVTARGRTLYTLRGERRRHVICTDACLTTWPPLKVPAGAKVEGVARLGVVRRPDGIRQATLKGHPLYTFAGDGRKGDVNGEGFRDVGTWHAARAPRSRAHR